MSDKSPIEWTATVHADGSVTPGATWNPVRGCKPVSPGCAHCYAETFAERWRGVPGHPYEQGFDLRLVPEKLDEPLRWKKPRRVFVNSMSDLFQDGVSETFIMDVFLTMEKCPQHTFQVLTKRAERMREVVSWLGRKWADCGDRWPLPNVWLGVSVENRQFLERIDALKDTPAAVHFVSFEPLLESLGALLLDGIEWAIVGGESGAGARQFDVGWARDIVRQCRAQSVPVFVKQLGAFPILDEPRWRAGDGLAAGHVRMLSARHHRQCPSGSVPLAFIARKAGDPTEWPDDLRVREFPEVRA